MDAKNGIPQKPIIMLEEDMTSVSAIEHAVNAVYKRHLLPAYGELLKAKDMAATAGTSYKLKGWIQGAFTKMLEPFDIKCEDPDFISPEATKHENDLSNMPRTSVPYVRGPSRKRARTVENASQPNFPNVRFPRGGNRNNSTRRLNGRR